MKKNSKCEWDRLRKILNRSRRGGVKRPGMKPTKFLYISCGR